MVTHLHIHVIISLKLMLVFIYILSYEKDMEPLGWNALNKTKLFQAFMIIILKYIKKLSVYLNLVVYLYSSNSTQLILFDI